MQRWFDCRYASRHSPDVCSDGAFCRDPFCYAACGQDPLSPVDARLSLGYMECSVGHYSGSCAGHAGACGHTDVRDEPEQLEQFCHHLVYRGSHL